MFWKSLILLTLTVALSVAATLHFGNEVLIALGMLLTQFKIIAKKAASIELPAVLVWLKTQASVFFKFELLKKWLTTTLLPLLLGSAVLRRIANFIRGYRSAVRRRYRSLLIWYGRLHWFEKILAALIILFATIALSVTSMGLWLVLFSVKLPLWIAAATAAFWRMAWLSIQKMTFKIIAFFQLKWLWRGVSRVLPASWLQRKRRFDYRVARAVIRRRRLTVRQLAEKKDSLPFRLGVLIEYLTGGRS